MWFKLSWDNDSASGSSISMVLFRNLANTYAAYHPRDQNQIFKTVDIN